MAQYGLTPAESAALENYRQMYGTNPTPQQLQDFMYSQRAAPMQQQFHGQGGGYYTHNSRPAPDPMQRPVQHQAYGHGGVPHMGHVPANRMPQYSQRQAPAQETSSWMDERYGSKPQRHNDAGMQPQKAPEPEIKIVEVPASHGKVVATLPSQRFGMVNVLDSRTMRVSLKDNYRLVGNLCIDSNNHSAIPVEINNKLDELLVRKSKMDVNNHIDSEALEAILSLDNESIIASDVSRSLKTNADGAELKLPEVTGLDEKYVSPRNFALAVATADAIDRSNVKASPLVHEIYIPVLSKETTKEFLSKLNTADTDVQFEGWLREIVSVRSELKEREPYINNYIEAELTKLTNLALRVRLGDLGASIDNFFDDYEDLIQFLKSEGVDESFAEMMKLEFRKLFPISSIDVTDEGNCTVNLDAHEIIISANLNGSYEPGLICNKVTVELWKAVESVRSIPAADARKLYEDSFVKTWPARSYTLVTPKQILTIETSINPFAPNIYVKDVKTL